MGRASRRSRPTTTMASADAGSTSDTNASGSACLQVTPIKHILPHLPCAVSHCPACNCSWSISAPGTCAHPNVVDSAGIDVRRQLRHAAGPRRAVRQQRAVGQAPLGLQRLHVGMHAETAVAWSPPWRQSAVAVTAWCRFMPALWLCSCNLRLRINLARDTAHATRALLHVD